MKTNLPSFFWIVLVTVVVFYYQACSVYKADQMPDSSSPSIKQDTLPNPESIDGSPSSPTLDDCSSHGCFYVSPTGTVNGNGSLANPWDLQTALNQIGAIQPGSRVWLRQGVYSGYFVSLLEGAENSPIIVSSYPGEKAVLDSGGPSPQIFAALTVRGKYVWFRDFEVFNSNSRRIYPDEDAVCWEQQHCRRPGIDVFGENILILNLVIHDTGVGLSLWNSAKNSHAYGNIIYYAGWEGVNRGAGHGIYTQNIDGYRHISENIIFSSFHSGIHAYGSSESTVRNINFSGNVIFGNGMLAQNPNGWGIIVGGNALTENIKVNENLLFNPAEFQRSNNLNPSYSSGTIGLEVTKNISVGFKAIDYTAQPTNALFSANSFFGFIGDMLRPNLDQSNSFGAFQDFPKRHFLRPNRYDVTRAHLILFGGVQSGDIDNIDLSPFLKVGDRFEIRNVQNLNSNTVGVLTYSGPISIDLTRTSKEVPATVGTVPRPASYIGGNQFGAFLIKKLK